MSKEKTVQEGIRQQFLAFMPEEAVLVDEPMKYHTTFKIGGPADLLLLPRNTEQIIRIFQVARENRVPVFVMGNGSNLLVRDKGLRMVVVKIAQNMNQVRFQESSVVAQAGVLLSSLANQALENQLTGLEFASGIPGTLGGAVAMNAGAYGGEMKDVVRSCQIVDQEGRVLTLAAEELEMGYRTSLIQKRGYVLLEAELRLQPGSYAEIKARMLELNRQRTEKQPLHLPSAGSVFKRPPGYFAGKLVQDSGLRGARRGGAQVSEQHCGFIVNVDQATAADVLGLIGQVQQEVKHRFQVALETEIRIIGEE